MSDGQVQEGHVVSDFNDRLWTDTTHGGTETTVEFEDSELVEDGWVDVGENLVRSDLLGFGSGNSVPVAEVSMQRPSPLTAFHPWLAR